MGEKDACSFLPMRTLVEQNGGRVDGKKVKSVVRSYRKVLFDGDLECPTPLERKKGQRARLGKTKSGNLLDRLRKF